MKPDCSVDECSSPSVARGFCDKHYRRWLHHGSELSLINEMHGKRRSAEYRIWCHMKSRCGTETDANYPDYGGRGIYVDLRWMSFSTFLLDMGHRPSPKHQLDRIDNNGPYCKENCRWVVAAINNRNRRSTKLTENDVADIRRSKARKDELAIRYGVSYSQICRVITHKRWKELEVIK